MDEAKQPQPPHEVWARLWMVRDTPELAALATRAGLAAG